MHAGHTDATGSWRQLVPPGALFAVAAWGVSFVATRVALGSLTPAGLVALRLTAGALILVAVIALRGGRPWPLRRDWPMCVVLGAILAGHLLLQSHGLRYTSAMNTGWIIGFIPVTIAVGAQLLGQQRLSPIGWLGVVTGTAGVLLVTMQSPPDFSQARWGDLLQITSCFTWTAYTLASPGVMTRSGALRATAAAMTVAAVITLLHATATGVFTRAPLPHELLALAFLGTICSGIAFYLWFVATHRHGPTRVSALLYLEPFVTLAAAAALLHEPITVNAVIGGVTVLVGVWLVARGAASTRPVLMSPKLATERRAP